MAVKVTIRNLKSIARLEFEVPMKGAFVITGANGCGKTSLLTVLHRMGAKNAFQTGLPGGKKANGIDGIQEVAIDYEINGKSVAYKYNNTRWSATPRANASIVKSAFSAVQFLKADSTRVEPTQTELKGVQKQPADPQLRAFMNAVFNTKKFDQLLKIKLRGRGLIAHLIERTAPGDKSRSFYSEKTFSLGELCAMRLGQKLLGMKNGGLYIIDEFEMALHPDAQIRLFRQIDLMTDKVNCTALVSTHSSSLIKNVKRSNIIFLENDAGQVTVHRNVYPTYALQHLSIEEDSAPDKLIFVEDTSAKHCVDAMWLDYVQDVKGAAQPTPLPSVQITVIGGFKEVLRFQERSAAFVPKMTRRLSALDKDAEVVCVQPVPVPGKVPVPLTVPQQFYESQKADVVFLPWTPEVGVCDLLASDVASHKQGLQAFTGITNLPLSLQELTAHSGKVGKDQRDTCKATVDGIAASIAQKNAWSQDRARESLFTYLVHAETKSNAQGMKTLRSRLFK